MDKYSKKDNHYAIYWARKIKAINTLGGKCSECGKIDPLILEFHHKNNEKESCISDLLYKHKQWHVIESEIRKCLLLCRNCHMEFHYLEKNKKSKLSQNKNNIKKNLIEMKGAVKCFRCGYKGRNIASLSFHHINSHSKKFNLSSSFHKKMDVLISEIQKCDVICANCHTIEHINTQRFNRLKGLIMNKVNNNIELKKTDHERVVKLYVKGLSTKKIAEILGRSKHTIKWILKEHEKKGDLKVRQHLVPVFMYKDDGVVEYFDSIRAAGKWLKDKNITNSRRPHCHISQCCSGKYLWGYGYKWMIACQQ